MSAAGDARIRDRLRKILELARRGEGGEKANAAAMLNALLKRHGMTLDDLDDSNEAAQIWWWKPRNNAERILLTQCIARTLNSREFPGYKNRHKKAERGYELTRVQYLEVDLLFTVHRRALAAHLKRQNQNALAAYIHTNALVSDSADQSPTAKRHAPEDAEAIIAMMMRMRPTPVHKALANGVPA